MLSMSPFLAEQCLTIDSRCCNEKNLDQVQLRETEMNVCSLQRVFKKERNL